MQHSTPDPDPIYRRFHAEAIAAADQLAARLGVSRAQALDAIAWVYRHGSTSIWFPGAAQIDLHCAAVAIGAYALIEEAAPTPTRPQPCIGGCGWTAQLAPADEGADS